MPLRYFRPIEYTQSNGSSLVLVIVGLAVAAVVAYWAMQSFTNQSRAFAYYRLQGEVDDLRNYYQRAVDCKKTFVAGSLPLACTSTAGGFIEVKMIDSFVHTTGMDTLIPAAAIGRQLNSASTLRVRATCRLAAPLEPRWALEMNRISTDGTKSLVSPMTGRLFNGGSPAVDGTNPATAGWKRMNSNGALPICVVPPL